MALRIVMLCALTLGLAACEPAEATRSEKVITLLVEVDGCRLWRVEWSHSGQVREILRCDSGTASMERR